MKNINLRRVAFGCFRILTVLYLTAMVALWAVQERLIYPGSMVLNYTSDVAPIADQAGLRPFSDESGRFIGFQLIREKPTNRGTIIVCHNNGSIAAGRGVFAHALNDRGFHVLLYEYPGYGGRDGYPTEKVIHAELRKLALSVVATGQPLYLVGESLGTGAACLLTQDKNIPIRGIGLVTPFDSIDHAARRDFPWLPVSWMLRDHFDSEDNLKDFHGPVFIAQADHDDIVGDECPDELYNSLPVAQRGRIIFQNCGHGDWPAGPQEPWWDEMVGWITRLSRDPEGHYAKEDLRQIVSSHAEHGN